MPAAPQGQPQQPQQKSKAKVFLIAGGVVVLGGLAVVTLFGSNLRALTATSANALGGTENATIGAGGSAGGFASAKRKRIANFGSSVAMDEGGGGFAGAPPPAAPAPAKPAEPSMGFADRLMEKKVARDDFGDDRPAQRPQVAALKAGATDDNQEFAEFVKFLSSWSDRRDTAGQADLVDVRERQFVRVTDARGQPIPTALVQVTDSANQTSWSGTTYGDGRVPFYPRAISRGLAPSGNYAVEASFGGMTVRSAWDGKSELGLKFDADRSINGALQLDVLFAIDTTGSMGDEIDRIKGTLLTVTDRLRGLRQEFDLRYGAVLFKDRGDSYVTQPIRFTRDINGFAATLQRVEAGGGGDEPEDVNAALTAAVDAEWRPAAAKIVFLIGDAAPHMDYAGEPTYAQAMKAAVGKGIRVHSVAASGLTALGTLVWRQVAQYSRGKFIFIEYGSAAATAESHGVKGDFKSNNLDDIIFEQIRDELSGWGKNVKAPANVAGTGDDQGPLQLRKRN